MDMVISSRKIVAILILVSFLAIAFFSFSMMHEAGSGQSNGCLFSTGEASICPQNVLALVVHHISAYQAFINVPVGSGLLMLLSLLSALVLVILVITRSSGWLSPPKLVLAGRVSDSYPPENSFQRKIIRWLSLLENSPAI